MHANEGFVPFRGHRTWYRVVGDDQSDGKLPVVLLHGGPGATHDYLEPLEGLAETGGRRVVFYDQIGCGKSDLPEDDSLWVVETFVDAYGAEPTTLWAEVLRQLRLRLKEPTRSNRSATKLWFARPNRAFADQVVGDDSLQEAVLVAARGF